MAAAAAEVFACAYSAAHTMTTPMAPELGLFLDEAIYAAYNSHRADTHEPVSLSEYAAAVAEFKAAHIYPHIARTEAKDHTVAHWLRELNTRNLSFQPKPVRLPSYWHPSRVKRARPRWCRGGFPCRATAGDGAFRGGWMLQMAAPKHSTVVSREELRCGWVVAMAGVPGAAQQTQTGRGLRSEGWPVRDGAFQTGRIAVPALGEADHQRDAERHTGVGCVQYGLPAAGASSAGGNHSE